MRSRVVPDPTHPTSEIPHGPDALSGSDSGVCVSVYTCVGAREHLVACKVLSPERLGLGPGLPKLPAMFAGEVIPGQGLHRVGAGCREIHWQESWLSKPAARAGPPVQQGLVNGITTLTSLPAGSCPMPSSPEALWSGRRERRGGYVAPPWSCPS